MQLLKKQRSLISSPTSGIQSKNPMVKMLNRKKYSPGKYAHVCFYHFADDDFKATAATCTAVPHFQKRNLKKYAVSRFNLCGQQKDQKGHSRSTAKSRNTSRKQHCCISSDTISSGDNTESFNEDVAAQTPVNKTEESNDNEDQQLATKEIAKLKKENEALKKQIFKCENLSGDEIKNYAGIDGSIFHTVAKIIEGFQPLNYRSGKTVNSITSHDQLLVCLMKLKKDLPYFDLAK